MGVRKRKRGIIAAQFNWLFILIVGVVIIAFFLTSSKHQEENADVELAVSLLKHLDPILSASERSPGTLQRITLPNMKIKFECDDTYSKLIVGDGYEQDMTYSILFSAEELYHNTLYTWSQDWNMPYKAASFLYLATPETKFYFIDDPLESKAEELFSGFPRNVTVEFVDPSSPPVFQDTGYRRYVFVFFDNDAGALNLGNIPPDKIFGVRIEPDPATNILSSYGTVGFSKGMNMNPDPSQESLYTGMPLLYGAIFSEDKGFYDCTFKKAMKRMELANTLNLKRVEMIESKLSDLDSCKPLYASPRISFEDIAAIGFDDPGIADLRTLYEGAQTLQSANEDLIRDRRCALLY